MTILRILLLILLFLMGRRVYRNLKAMGRPAKPGPGGGTGRAQDSRESAPGMQDLTDQDISDADFEEIP